VLKLPIIDHAISIVLPNKDVYSYPLMTPNNLSSDHNNMNTNIHLIGLRYVKQHYVNP